MGEVLSAVLASAPPMPCLPPWAAAGTMHNPALAAPRQGWKKLLDHLPAEGSAICPRQRSFDCLDRECSCALLRCVVCFTLESTTRGSRCGNICTLTWGISPERLVSNLWLLSHRHHLYPLRIPQNS